MIQRDGRNFHVTFDEDDEAISQVSTEGNAVNFNKVSSFPADEFIKPRNTDILSQMNSQRKSEVIKPVIVSLHHKSSTPLKQSLALLLFKKDGQEKKHTKLVNITGEPLASITTRNKVRYSEAAYVHECLYVNFLSQIKPKRLCEALEEEG
ncbi:hypothetical protein Tco_1514042 [Tanacetum coccineum]